MTQRKVSIHLVVRTPRCCGCERHYASGWPKGSSSDVIDTDLTMQKERGSASGLRLFECDSPNQLLEPRVRTNAVKPRLEVQPDHAITTIYDGLVDIVDELAFGVLASDP